MRKRGGETRQESFLPRVKQPPGCVIGSSSVRSSSKCGGGADTADTPAGAEPTDAPAAQPQRASARMGSSRAALLLGVSRNETQQKRSTQHDTDVCLHPLNASELLQF